MSSILESIKKIFSSGHRGSVVGIDIGSSSIKIIEIKKTDDKAVLQNYGEISLGPRAGVSLGQATNMPPERIAEALRDLLRETGIVIHHVSFAIPFSSSLLSVVEFPDVGKGQLDTMVPLEARRYIPVPLADVLLDWWIIPKRKKEVKPKTVADSGAPSLGKVEVILVAIHKEVMRKYEVIKKELGLTDTPSHFEIEIFSTLRSVAGSEISSLMIIDIGAASTKLVIIDEGMVRGSHVVSMGGQDISFAVSKSLNISFDEAEQMKCRVGMVGEEEGRDIATAADLITSNIMNEAARFANSYESKHGTILSKIILVGGGSRLKGMGKIVEQNLQGKEILLGNPFARVSTPAFLTPTLKEIGQDFSVAIGAAMRGLGE
ncbi:MAG: type IV pilus assembly protein PilM [Candidatus Yonathbacteria bacterium]|nr:type IV pilus assembly protein PilM [Candidatus Yonathbacteria bacterium]